MGVATKSVKDFTIKEAAHEAALNFPGIPKDVVEHLCKAAFANIVDIIKNKKGRIRLQHAEIHTIYFDVVPEEQRAILADLDESRVLTEEEDNLFIIERANAKTHLPGEIKRLNRRYKRVHNPGHTPDSALPQ